jgi:hypothetical protein
MTARCIESFARQLKSSKLHSPKTSLRTKCWRIVKECDEYYNQAIDRRRLA